MKLSDLFESNDSNIKIVPLKIKNGWVNLHIRNMGRDRWSFQVYGKTQQLAFGEFQGFYQNGQNLGSVQEIVVVEKFRRLGIATAIYDYFGSLGYRVVPSDDVKPDGQAFWKSRKLFEDDDAPKPLLIRLGSYSIPENAPSKKFMSEFESLTEKLFLNPRKRSLGSCIVELKVTRFSEVHLADIQSSRAGDGTAMMNLICDLADKYGVKLTGHVQGREAFSSDTWKQRSDEWLLKWYARWGFYQEDPDDMDIVRWPDTSQG